MKRIIALILISLTLHNCKKESFSSDSLQNFLISNDKSIIKINDHKEFISSSEKSKLFQNLKVYKTVDSIQSVINHLKVFSPISESYLTLGADNTFTYITKYSDKIIVQDSTQVNNEIIYKGLDNTISKLTINNKLLFATIKDSVLLFSNSEENLKLRLLNTKSYYKANDLIESLDDSENFSTIIKSDNFRYLNINDSISSSSENYYALDLDVSSNHLYASGVVKTIDSAKTIFDAFKNTLAQNNAIVKVSPKHVDKLVSFTFNDVSKFRSNLNTIYRDGRLVDSIVPFFDYINEIGTITKNNKLVLVMTSLDAELTEESFFESIFTESYKDVKLFKLKSDALFLNWFYPLITNPVSNYCRLDDFFVFSEDLEFLKSIITNYLNESTLANSDAYLSLQHQLNDESSLLLLSNTSQLNTSLNNIFNTTESLDLNENTLSAFQFTYETDYAHINIAIEESSNKRAPNDIRELQNITLDADILNEPQVVINHKTRQKDILVQDVNNTMYLISNSGTILWKKQLNGPILGTVEQIDTYKNGRLQLAFATPNRVYVLDRNGNDVNDFPLKFKDNITQPLSVFDYDKRKNYRLLVTQNSKLLMYDKNGKTVSGFEFNGTTKSIHSQPKHFRLGSKDYIVFPQGEKLQILNRVGKTRVSINSTIAFSGNPIFIHKGKFTTTTSNGTLYQIDTRGRVSEINLNLNENHNMVASSKTLVTLNDNILKIKSNVVDLPYGNYTLPKLFYLQDKIYVSVTDLQTKKVYLFNSLGKAISNFPVYGNSAMTLDNMDNDSRLEFIVKGDDNSVLLYKIN
ncbi:ribonuclease HII [Ichthyenterobacterium sp. W332]|uniref:Ribonuclease HII n=1 Tax=Microcosmobacter mediterraneus TaxID=3075607 RepID=A0ABU2YPW9_9FLAO|nr:ribonuclease HII [Ichthyenterobacterium sp. W332]MDT0559093.1 ribonuclease HII [Ichthyenterobacterium sp. W332]